MQRMPLDAALVGPHAVDHDVGPRRSRMKEEIRHGGQSVAEEEGATFHPDLPKAGGRGGAVSALANVMLQMGHAVQRLNFVVKLVEPGELELSHPVEEDVLNCHSSKMNEVERISQGHLDGCQGCGHLDHRAQLRSGVQDLLQAAKRHKQSSECDMI